MAKKIPKIKTPKTKMSFLDKLLVGIGAGSPVVGRDRLYQSMSGTTASGSAAKAAQRAALIKKFGKWGMRGARLTGLLNPWTAVPFGLMSLAQYGVGKGLEPYRDETGKIGEAGHAKLLQNRLAREELMTSRNRARGQENVTGMFNHGGLARLL